MATPADSRDVADRPKSTFGRELRELGLVDPLPVPQHVQMEPAAGASMLLEVHRLLTSLEAPAEALIQPTPSAHHGEQIFLPTPIAELRRHRQYDEGIEPGHLGPARGQERSVMPARRACSPATSGTPATGRRAGLARSLDNGLPSTQPKDGRDLSGHHYRAAAAGRRSDALTCKPV